MLIDDPLLTRFIIGGQERSIISPSRQSLCAEVDRLFSELKAIGAVIVGEPKNYPEYTPRPYYALFFKDPEGIKYEIVCTQPK